MPETPPDAPKEGATAPEGTAQTAPHPATVDIDSQPARRGYDARGMCGDGNCARLVLDDKIYTLRITKSGKLILTK